MSDFQEFKRVNTRKASIVQVGGLRPTGDPLASNFGLKPLGLPGEEWPSLSGKPLMFICQLNLTAAPFVPEILQDLKLITFFVKPKRGKLKKENGADWHLRAYQSLDGLVPLALPINAPAIKRGFECHWEECEDHPNYDDPEMIVPEDFDASDVELDNVAKSKIGGYPSTIQGEPWWALKDHASKPVFCLQINSEEKVDIAWGDGGTIYLARGSAEGCEDQWFLDWQCF